MAASNTIMSSPCRCYFSHIPPSGNSSHNNDLTPIDTPSDTLFTPIDKDIPADPSYPLLAIQPSAEPRPLRSYQMDASTLLQLQTQTAHVPSSTRPQPRPLQNVLHVGDDGDSSPDDEPSSSSFTSDDVQSSMRTVRCSRCQRTASINVTAAGQSNFLSYGLNLYYCSRCATIVGYNR